MLIISDNWIISLQMYLITEKTQTYMFKIKYSKTNHIFSSFMFLQSSKYTNVGQGLPTIFFITLFLHFLHLHITVDT